MLLPAIETAHLALPCSRSTFDNALDINIKPPDCLTIVIAHAVLARFCTLKSPKRSSAALANAANRCASDWLAVANAHAVLARFCTLKSRNHTSAAVANAAKSCAHDWFAIATLANAHAVLARSCTLKSPN